MTRGWRSVERNYASEMPSPWIGCISGILEKLMADGHHLQVCLAPKHTSFPKVLVKSLGLCPTFIGRPGPKLHQESLTQAGGDLRCRGDAAASLLRTSPGNGCAPPQLMTLCQLCFKSAWCLQGEKARTERTWLKQHREHMVVTREWQESTAPNTVVASNLI